MVIQPPGASCSPSVKPALGAVASSAAEGEAIARQDFAAGVAAERARVAADLRARAKVIRRRQPNEGAKLPAHKQFEEIARIEDAGELDRRYRRAQDRKSVV